MQRRPYPGEELQTKHSFTLPLPFTPSTQTRCLTSAPGRKKKSLTFSTNYWKQCRGRGRQTFGILKTMVSGKICGAPTVWGRWANFRVTSANTNNCSGSLLLSALEVWVEFFNALQPISLPLIFPPLYDSSSSKTPVSLSFQFSQCFEITTAHKHKWNHKRHNERKFSVVIPGPHRFKSTKQDFQCLRSAPRAADRTQTSEEAGL